MITIVPLLLLLLQNGRIVGITPSEFLAKVVVTKVAYIVDELILIISDSIDLSGRPGITPGSTAAKNPIQGCS
jgi:hypothetical protein